MRVALALLCVGAVAFLVRVLVALLKEGTQAPPTVRFHFARFNPSKRGGELVVMNLEAQKPEFPSRAANG
jgi:branched-subunit amino acid transport protein